VIEPMSHVGATHRARGGNAGRRAHANYWPTWARRASIVASALLLSVGLLAAPAATAGTVLYVDNADPNCSDTGSGTAAEPFCSITAAAQKATAGTTVQVRSGTYRGDVRPARSGTASNPIIFEPAPGAAVTISGGNNGIKFSGRSWVVARGFTVTGTSSYGIYVYYSSNITVSGNRVTESGQPVSGLDAQGIYVNSSSNSVIVGNTVDHNSDSGIYVTKAASTGNLIKGNTVFANARQYERGAAGIDVRAPGNRIEQNLSYGNEDSGIQVYSSAEDTVVAGNLSDGNGDHGIDVLNSSGVVIVANTVHDNVTAGVNIEGSSTGATLANNISVDNGVTSGTTKGNIRVDSTAVTGTSIDYDLVFRRTAGTIITWGSTQYSSLSAFRAATGQETHGTEADPLWVAPASRDYHLAPGSPAIDSADSGAPNQPATDLDGAARVDDPATPNTGAGVRAYDDRGAYEFVPQEEPPAADLVVTPSTGVAPLTVTADASGSVDNDATPIATYAFDWGDGTSTPTQAEPTATHTYPNIGTYTVTVTVTDTAGLSSSATADVSATDVPPEGPPTARLTVSPVSGVAPLAVTADAAASTDDDPTPIATYAFDWGDGTGTPTQPGPTATHTYPNPGSYVVTVTVTDTAGLSSTTAVTVDVYVDSPPVAAVTVTPSSGNAPLPVTADASGSTTGGGAPITAYAFDWGDGGTTPSQAAPTATHTYATGGTYTVTVTATNAAGLTDTAATQVSVDYVANPGFEAGLTGWNNAGRTGITLTRTAGGHSGAWSVSVANTGTAGTECTLNDAPNWVATTMARTYTGAIWVRGEAPGANVSLKVREYQGPTLVGQSIATVTLSTTWQRLALTYTPRAPGQSTLDVTVYVPSSPVGHCFYADDASLTTS